MGYTYSGNDLLSGRRQPVPAGAWGARLLHPAYTGPLLRVRRSSDNTELDIGAVGDALDTAALLAFAGSGSAFLRTVYDQGPLGINATQTGTGPQPRIVNAGALEQPGSRTAWRHDGSDDYLTLGNVTPTLDSALSPGHTWVVDVQFLAVSGQPGLFCKGNLDSSSSGSYFLQVGGGTLQSWVYSGSARSGLNSAFSASINTWYQVAVAYAAGVTNARTIYVDGILRATRAFADGVIDAAGHALLFGSNQGNTSLTNYPLSGYLRAVRLYQEYLTPGAIQAIYAAGA